MPKYSQTIISTITEYTSYISDKIEHTKAESLWFRGVTNATYELVPRLYRDDKPVKNLIHLEREMSDWFYARSTPFCDRDLKDDWEIMYFTQHYGVPTRLLDWTENPFIALFFALKLNTPQRDTDAADSAVWILDPRKWNSAASNAEDKMNRVLFKNDDSGVQRSYQLGSLKEGPELLPLAIYGTYNSYRIAAQKGAFTIFGASKDPMENYFSNKKYRFNRDCLSKVVFPSENRDSLLSALLSIGITESTVSPDLDGLARESCRVFGFKE